MPRQATGTVDQRRWQDGRTITYRLRIPWKGRRIPVRLGTNHEGWSRERAEVELERAMGQIERGTWRRLSGSSWNFGGDPRLTIRR